jgi:hypothetical protein
MAPQQHAHLEQRLAACGRTTFLAVLLLAAACGPSTGMGDHDAGDPGRCSQVHEGDLVVCTHSCSLRAIPDAEIDLLRNISVVTGKLHIVRTDLVDLSAFECLEEADDIHIVDNQNLESLHGLNNVRRIARQGKSNDWDWKGIKVYSNPRLRSLDGLDSLREVPDLGIHLNESLNKLNLNQIEHIGRLELGWCGRNSQLTEATGHGDNPSLTALDGLDSLASIEKLSVAGQSNLTSIARLTELAQRGVQFTQVEFHVNERLERADIDAFMNTAGATGTVCGNGGDDTPCPCPIGLEPCICPPYGG